MISMKSYADKADVELIALAATDRNAFGELYERYVNRIYNYIYYRTNHHQDAEDLTAKVFMRALKHIEHYDERGVPFSAWLYRIAHNLVANWYRDKGRRKIIALEDYFSDDETDDQPEDVAVSQEEREALLRSIRRLPPERQQLLVLKYIERRSNAEIGDIMQKTEGAIKSLYYRTLSFLRDELSEGDRQRAQQD